MSGDNQAYAAAELATALRGDDPGKAVKSWAGLIDDEEMVRLLNYYDSLLDEPIEETPLGQRIISSAATATTDRAVRNGAVSQMKAVTGLTNQSKDGSDALSKIAETLKNEGTISLLLGSPGTGKTATALDCARVWKAMTGGTVVSNIRSWEGTDVVAETDEEMKEEMQAVEGQVLAVLDETGQYLTGEGERVKHAQKFAKTLKYIRKRLDDDDHARRGSALLIGHTRREVAASIRRLVSLMMEKPSQENKGRLVLYTSDGGKDSREQDAVYEGLTDTSESYDERESSNFRVIIDDDDDGDNPDPEEIAWQKDVKTVIRAKMDGATHAKAAKPTDWKSSWAGDRWREWLRGEHREIVPMPDDPPEHVERALEQIE